MPVEIPTRSCGTSECNSSEYKGQSLAIYQKGEDCTKRLRRQRAIKAPSIPIHLTDDVIEHRDGSDAFPIKLPAMQKYTGTALPKLIGMLPDGTLVAWDFGYFAGRKKFVLESGQITMTGDYGSDLLDQPICSAACAEISGAIGYKAIIESCIGQPDKTVYQLCRIPACCCETSPAEVCVACAALDAIVNPVVV